MKKKLAFVFAHPDDETFACGGTICHYARFPDVEIHLICATRGEAGKTGSPPQCRPEELGQVREQELYRAAGILGIDTVTFLDLVDGTLHLLDTEELAQKIRFHLEKIGPQIVITFPHHGISGHKDHIAIHHATRTCIEKDPLPFLEALYYVTIPHYGDDHEPIDVAIVTEAYKTQVMRALQEHRTQNMSVNRVFPGVLDGDPRAIRPVEHYTLGWKRSDFIPSQDDLFGKEKKAHD